MCIRMKQLTHKFKHVKEHWLTLSFIFGFLNDFLLLNQVDNIFDNLILLFYVCLATLSLLLFYVGIAQKGPTFLRKKLVRFMPMLMQYSFGGVLSGMLIFYGRSGSWLNNAPFLILIILVILGNEFVSKRSDRLVNQISLYFIGLFAYMVLVLPVILGKMGDIVFFFSGVIALLLVTIVVQLLYRIVPNFMRINTRRVILSIGAIYVGFNVLYYTNIIPPIPLSLTELEVVQSVARTETGSYRIVYEDSPWWQGNPIFRDTIHPTGSTISCFARVFAPTRLSTTIFHQWEYKDANGDWVKKPRISYPISGSNVGGYRGYTTISSFADGTWRCSVETGRGQILGRKVFIIEKGAAKNLVTRVE